MTTLLLILDGWGCTDVKEGNAIYLAKTPNFDYLWKQCPHLILSASGLDVGLPAGQMGNSEVGHMNLGAGCVVMQELTSLELSIQDGSFYQNLFFRRALDLARVKGKKVHIIGLLSDGGVHSHFKHIEALLKMAADNGNSRVYLHAFLDGRDTPPKSASKFIEQLQQSISKFGCGKIASLCGRFYAMDRDKRWDRVEKAYNLLVKGKTEYVCTSALEGLRLAYQRQETDEFVQPTLIDVAGCIEEGDVVFFMNFRADRARELSYALMQASFKEFNRAEVKLGAFVTLTRYAKDLPAEVAFPPKNLENILGEVVAKAGMKQLRIAETEKYAHVTYFFNGGQEQAFKGEERILVPSPKVETYDLQPEMSAAMLTKELVAAIRGKNFDLIVANYANPDMVGHTGKLEPTIRAVEAVDEALGEIIRALKESGGELVLVADHGNAECITLADGTPCTTHTTNKVPFIYWGKRRVKLKGSTGTLADVAPTLLRLMKLPMPDGMTGKSLLKWDEN